MVGVVSALRTATPAEGPEMAPIPAAKPKLVALARVSLAAAMRRACWGFSASSFRSCRAERRVLGRAVEVCSARLLEVEEGRVAFAPDARSPTAREGVMSGVRGVVTPEGVRRCSGPRA